MTVKAVIFDLFGTLVYDKFSSEKYPLFLTRQASLLSLNAADFSSLWQSSYLNKPLVNLKPSRTTFDGSVNNWENRWTPKPWIKRPAGLWN